MLMTAEKESWSDTDKAARIEASINRLRRTLMPVAKAVQGAKAAMEE